MPKSPIKHRTLLFYRLRSSKRSPIYRLLDWTLVETSIGPGLEPRTMIRPSTGFAGEDVFDSGFDAVMEVSEGAQIEQLGTMGVQIPVTFNRANG